jgi:Fur family ferric uptake transcriptional regulator
VPGAPIGKHVRMAEERDSGEMLRAGGLRVTPQRRAVLGAFERGEGEHLSADEVHARATTVIPEIGRGTVYSALAELTEVGLLSAHGNVDPVRYETNTAAHQHFRCRLCLRLTDVEVPAPATDELTLRGFVVERLAVTAEGICADCVAYEKGLLAGARRARGRATSALPDGIAAGAVDTAVGRLTLGATPKGVVRIVFEDHADVEGLEKVIRARRGTRAAREHVAAAQVAVGEYFARRPVPSCTIDWDSLDHAATLRATMAAPFAGDLSYDALDTPAGAADRGRALGGNPVVVLVPCHRVTRGREVPAEYVGGAARREALRALERT